MNAIIYGSKSYALLIEQLATTVGYKILGFLDDTNPSNNLGSYAKNKEQIQKEKIPIFLGIGYTNLKARHDVLKTLLADGVNLPNLIHPSAHVAKNVQFGTANIVMAMSSIDSFCKIGSGNVFWPGSIISHDSQIQDNCFISPGAILCGFTEIDHSTFIGAGAVVVDRTKISANSFIKANALAK